MTKDKDSFEARKESLDGSLSLYELCEMGKLDRRTCNSLIRDGFKTLSDIVDKESWFVSLHRRSDDSSTCAKISALISEYRIAHGLPSYQEQIQERIKQMPEDLTIQEMRDGEIISVRTANCLQRGKIFTLKHLRETSYEDLKRIRNLGDGCLKEINYVLNMHTYKSVAQLRPDLTVRQLSSGGKLSYRIAECLEEQGIFTLQDLATIQLQQLVSIDGLLQKDIQDIMILVKRYLAKMKGKEDE